MKFLIYFFCFVALQGCVTERACRAKFPPVVTVKDSIVEREKVVYKDRVVRDTIPGQKVSTALPANATKSVSKKSNGLRVTATPLPNGSTQVECESDSLIREIKVRDKEIERLRLEIREKSEVKEVKPPIWWMFAGGLGGGLAAAFILWIAGKLLRR